MAAAQKRVATVARSYVANLGDVADLHRVGPPVLRVDETERPPQVVGGPSANTTSPTEVTRPLMTGRDGSLGPGTGISDFGFGSPEEPLVNGSTTLSNIRFE